MAPRADKISGPAVIRHLLVASEAYQRVIKDVVGQIQDAISDGAVVETELEYAQLLLALAETEPALSWVAERSRVLLGEAEA